jgi:small subunit ribosomal protein S7
MRKKRSTRRRIAPDPKFNDVLVARFINNILKDGRKATARGIVYDALAMIGTKTEKNPVDVFRKAVENASPLIEVRARRVGGATYQVPTEVRPERRTALAIRWLISNATERSEGKSMSQKLAAELLAASAGDGGAIKKKDDVHRMAEANRAFAHFRW